MGLHDSRRVAKPASGIDLAPELLTADFVDRFDLIRCHLGERPFAAANQVDAPRERMGTEYRIAAPSSGALVKLHVDAPGPKDPIPFQRPNHANAVATRGWRLATNLYRLDSRADWR